MEHHPCQNYSSDQQLIDNLTSAGFCKRKAEDQLFTKYAYLIHAGMNKYLITEEESFDAYADTVLAAIQAITNGSFQRRSSFKTFIYEIYQNKCIDLIRKKNTLKNRVHSTISLVDLDNQLSDHSRSIMEELVNKSAFEAVRLKMNQLCENCQNLLLLSADGYSDREIAEKMNFKTASVVKTSRLRCIKKLRALVCFREKRSMQVV